MDPCLYQLMLIYKPVPIVPYPGKRPGETLAERNAALSAYTKSKRANRTSEQVEKDKTNRRAYKEDVRARATQPETSKPKDKVSGPDPT